MISFLIRENKPICQSSVRYLLYRIVSIKVSVLRKKVKRKRIIRKRIINRYKYKKKENNNKLMIYNHNNNSNNNKYKTVWLVIQNQQSNVHHAKTQ